MAAKHVEITVVRTSGGCKVVPPYAMVANGDTIAWKNRTGAPVVLFFPHDSVFGSDPPFNHGIPHNHEHSPTRPNPGGPVRAAVAGQVIGANLPFAVYCEATNTFAEGNSQPEIIIEG